MHYANGKEVKVGDKIVGKTSNGSLLAGVVVAVLIGTQSDNISVVPNPIGSFNLKASECMLIDDGRKMSADEAINVLMDELAAGHEVIPIGECNNFDYKKGCLGHEQNDQSGNDANFTSFGGGLKSS
jgi:hypothetical protein